VLLALLRRVAGSAGPYRLHLFLLSFTSLLLLADARFGDLRSQLALGALTFAVLWACARRLDRRRRSEVWLCVPVAMLFEACASLVWGGYTYRLENIPLYVPPGHALVLVFGIAAGTLPVVRSHGLHVRRTVLGLCSVWTVSGLTLLPLLGNRLDLQGALLWPLFAWCVLRSRRGELFAAIWLMTSTIELVGTWAGDWAWAATAPWSNLPSGNPPSAIAAGYAVIDGTVVLLASRLFGAFPRPAGAGSGGLRARARRGAETGSRSPPRHSAPSRAASPT
jgi:hypothetical protein